MLCELRTLILTDWGGWLGTSKNEVKKQLLASLHTLYIFKLGELEFLVGMCVYLPTQRIRCRHQEWHFNTYLIFIDLTSSAKLNIWVLTILQCAWSEVLGHVFYAPCTRVRPERQTSSTICILSWLSLYKLNFQFSPEFLADNRYLLILLSGKRHCVE